MLKLRGIIGWSFVRWIWCDMCVIDICDNVSFRFHQIQTKKNIAKVQPQPTNENQQARYFVNQGLVPW